MNALNIVILAIAIINAAHAEDYQRLISAALANVPEKLPDPTVPDVSPETLLSIAANTGSDRGLASASPIEKDIRNLDSFDFYLKYGSAEQDLLDRLAEADQQVTSTRLQEPDLLSSLRNIGVSTAQGLLSIPQALSAFGSFLFHPKLASVTTQENQAGQ